MSSEVQVSFKTHSLIRSDVDDRARPLLGQLLFSLPWWLPPFNQE